MDIQTILLLFLAYLIGSIPSGVWIGKLFFNIDIREHGSKSSGTTNTFRVLGKKAGRIVFIIDLLKGTLATVLPLIFHNPLNPLWFGLCAILGHTFPIFAQFKGGKAVATSGGMLLGYSPTFFLYSLILYIILLYLTSMVSLTSMLSAIIITISTIFMPKYFPQILPEYDPLFTILAGLITLFIIIRHRGNIIRILHHEEPKINFGLNKKKQ